MKSGEKQRVAYRNLFGQMDDIGSKDSYGNEWKIASRDNGNEEDEKVVVVVENKKKLLLFNGLLRVLILFYYPFMLP